jgi:phytoene desaturase
LKKQTNTKEALVVGSGLGGLATALRLAKKGYKVKILEKYTQAGGRLNQIKQEGFTFDMGPSFFSMSYEFDRFFESCGYTNPLKFNKLDPLYNVYFSDRKNPYRIFSSLKKLALEFSDEKNFEAKTERYLKQAAEVFHSTEYKVVKKNFNSRLHYISGLTSVPLKHASLIFRNMWQELDRHYETEDVKIIFSLVAFFLGATPFQTPAVYSLLNYTELKHDGYWNVEGGMYRIVEELLSILAENKVEIEYGIEVKSFESDKGKISSLRDQNNKSWKADIYVINADAAAFRGKVMNRRKYSEKRLDKMKWTLAPFTIYLGVEGKTDGLHHHNYFLGNNFKAYADYIFKTSVSPEKPYYYVNVSSKQNPESAPPGCENIFILCPVPDLRYKSDWSDKEQLADNIIANLSNRINFDLKANTKTMKIMDPYDWQEKFGLYRGSGLGLAHGMGQIGGFRPSNKDEEFSNLYYVGASTTPGTGLPIVLISSELVMERIEKDYGAL